MQKIRNIVWVLGVVPMVWVITAALVEGLGEHPLGAVIRVLGDWALRFLLISLAVTPLKMLTNWGWVAGLRRTFALIAFAYASLHVVLFGAVVRLFDADALAVDWTARPLIALGIAAYGLLAVLAMTSVPGLMRRVGLVPRRLGLHRVVYGVAPLVVAHFWMMTDGGSDLPLLYGLAAASLVAMRLVRVSMRQVTPDAVVRPIDKA